MTALGRLRPQGPRTSHEETTMSRSASTLLITVLSIATPLVAQETLPAPPTPFKGQIGLSYKDSKPDFPQPVHAPKGAPNILLVLLDDAGYGASSTFGGPIPSSRTLNLDATDRSQNVVQHLLTWSCR